MRQNWLSLKLYIHPYPHTQDRLQTLENVRDAGLSTCCGGILGLGESHEDRVSLLHTLSTMRTHPESVPVNALVPNEGTPMEEHKKVPVFDMVRMISAARILMPLARVRYYSYPYRSPHI